MDDNDLPLPPRRKYNIEAMTEHLTNEIYEVLDHINFIYELSDKLSETEVTRLLTPFLAE